MRFLREADSFINRFTALDHVKWARLSNEGCIEFGIFAGEIELANDRGRGNRFVFGASGLILGVAKTEREKEGGSG